MKAIIFSVVTIFGCINANAGGCGGHCGDLGDQGEIIYMSPSQLPKAQESETFTWTGRFRRCAELSKSENWVCTSQDWTLGSKAIFLEKNKNPCYFSVKEDKALPNYSWVPRRGPYEGVTLEGTAVEGRLVSQSVSSIPLTIVYAWDVYGQEEFDHIVLNGKELFLDRGLGSDQELKIEMCKNMENVLKVL